MGLPSFVLVVAAITADQVIDSRALSIRAEGIRVQYAGMPNSYIGSAVMASILTAILQTDMAAHIWGPWLAGMYAQALARWWLRQRFMAAAPPDHDIARWGCKAKAGGEGEAEAAREEHSSNLGQRIPPLLELTHCF